MSYCDEGEQRLKMWVYLFFFQFAYRLLTPKYLSLTEILSVNILGLAHSLMYFRNPLLKLHSVCNLPLDERDPLVRAGVVQFLCR